MMLVGSHSTSGMEKEGKGQNKLKGVVDSHLNNLGHSTLKDNIINGDMYGTFNM